MTQAQQEPEHQPPDEASDQANHHPSRPKAVTRDDPEALRQEAEEQVRRNATILRQYPLPVTAEPAFVFRASSASRER